LNFQGYFKIILYNETCDCLTPASSSKIKSGRKKNMYLLKNALKSITRAKTRNVLIIIIACIITVSACIALSIRQSADSVKKATLADMKITAQISVDRQALMTKAINSGQDRQQIFQNIPQLTLEDQQKYAASQYVNYFYYTITSSFNGDDKLAPVDTSGSTSDTSGSASDTSGNTSSGDSSNPNADNSAANDKGFGNRGGFMGMQGDFTVVGYSSHDGMTAFLEGTSKIVEGTVFEDGTDKADCIISDELALLNNLKVGDAITLINPNKTDETVTMNIVGIYNNSEASAVTSENMRGFNASSDPANRIYLSYNALKKIVDASAATATVTTDAETGREISDALRGQEAGTYVFSNTDDYNAFQKDVVTMGLDTSTYTVSSSDLNSFEQRIAPLERLSSISSYFLLVVLLIGGAILIVFNVFAIRERKYEIGVLAAIGMNKFKVAFQFISEVFIVTFIAIIIGAGIGAATSVPVADKLLAGQVEAAQTTQQNTMSNFGGGYGGRMNAIGTFMPGGFNRNANVNYITDITASVDMAVLLQLLGIGILLTIISSAASVGSILRYDPLKILSNRS
jgi:putative ABC transport system permease protein